MKYIFGNWLVGEYALVNLNKIHNITVYDDKLRLFPTSSLRKYHTYQAISVEEAQIVFEEIKNWIPVNAIIHKPNLEQS